MILWPRIEAAPGEPVIPSGLWRDFSAASPEAHNAPPVDLASSAVPASASPPLDPAAPRSRPLPRARRWSRVLAAFAFLISTGLHAAVLAFFLDRLSRAGVEAETAAVSVEIVLEAPPAPTVAASAGMPAEATPEPAEIAEAGTAAPEIAADEDRAAGPEESAVANQPPDPPEEEIGEAAPEPVEQEVASPPDPAPPPPLERLAEIVPRDPVAELTPPLPAPEPARPSPKTLPPGVVFAQAPPPEVDAPVPSPRPAYQVAKPKSEKRKVETVAAEPTRPAKRIVAKTAEAAKAQPSAKPREQAEETAGSRASTASSAAAKGGASAGAAAKYGQRLLSHVERHKRYPEAAARRKITGATKLAITIDRTGQLADAKVAGGSGHAILDEEAVAVARRAAPYPRPPEGVAGNMISFSVTLRFTR